VLDLSGLPGEVKTSYLRRLPAAVAAERAEHGVPHWVITDEAHLAVTDGQVPSGPGLAEPGTCVITWRADMLPATFRGTVDLTLKTTTPPADSSAPAPRATISVGGEQPRLFTVAARISPHVRHQHKYMAAPLPPERRFYFHTLGEAGIAATLEEFSRHLRHCDPAILAYHLSREDFSRWVTQTLADHSLGRQVAAIERDLSQHHAAALERARHQIMHAIDSRYPGSAGDQDGT
jgi:hypothetical protein